MPKLSSGKSRHRLTALLPTLLVLTALQGQSRYPFQPSEADFPNPERGFYRYSETRSGSYTPLGSEELNQYRLPGSTPSANYSFVSTLVFRYFFLADFKDRPISQRYLTQVKEDLHKVRQAGMKIIPRFAYTDEVNNGGCDDFICPPYGDAPKSVVLKHIEQLRPILHANADIIATLQMGFIGTWGENYYTDYFGNESQQGQLSTENWADRSEVLSALLDALPAERSIQLRYPHFKQVFLFGPDASTNSPTLTDEDAYSHQPKARLGFHNDCFLSSFDGVGTYVDYGNSHRESHTDTAHLKPYVAADSRFAPVGGETCDDKYSPQNNCASEGGRAETELRRMHFSYLNSDFNNDVNNDWQSGGCMEYIKRHLGYRFELLDATFPSAVPPGGPLDFSFRVINRGFAAPFNPRAVELLLRHAESGEVFAGAVGANPRNWGYEQGINEVTQRICLPEDIGAGEYEVLLHLPDPVPELRGRPEYSIRLANTLGGVEIWEAATGYNKLGVRIRVDESAGGACSGGEVFHPLTGGQPLRFLQTSAKAEGGGD